ncbi:MAG: 2Fe-2S iron-sulfur cluster binding domain-containing protein [Chloroflexi bacterium]|nr:2Fe-2S iron-sulfur cluster binding domain-containing protein [Chloroflexota bacterium]
MELVNWLQDVREHLRVSQRRKSLRQPDQGFDYTNDKYQDVVHRVVSAIHPKRMQLRVTEIIQETPSTKTFRCQRTDGPLPPFRPGQYVNVFVDVDGVLTSRPYSIASAPGGDMLDLTVRDKPGGFVAPYLLHEVQVGDELESTGPEGSFYHEALIDGDELVFFAGGSGITPFMSIVRDAFGSGAETSPLRIHLLYGSRVPEDVIYSDELAELAASHSNFNYSLVISEPPPGFDGLAGFLDADLIKKRVGDVTGKTFYICGPNVMYDFCSAALEQLGVPSYKIKRELYGPPDDVTKEPGWPKGVSGDTMFDVEVVGYKTVRAPAGEPLMNTLERYGIVVPAICRSGECSACRTRLLSGQVFQPAHTGLRESDREHGYIHACVSYPLGDLRIRL